MIQKKLHIPGKVERASLETDKSWREVSWWWMVVMKNIHVESHMESYVKSEWYWRAQKVLLTCQYHSDSHRKIV
jgi:hypothetical protein